MNSISRRTFIGTAAGTVSAGTVASLGMAALTSTAAETETSAAPRKSRDIRVGMLTAPLRDLPFEGVLDIAKRCRIAALEVVAEPGHPHIDPMTLNSAQVEGIKQKLGERGLEISGLSNFMNITAPGKSGEFQQVMIKTIDAAASLGVPTVCMNLGTPVQGMSKIETIKKVIPGLMRPIIDHAKDKGIKVAVENWFETNLQGLDTFDCLMDTIRDENFGFNYDPSHLVHQQCDYLVPITRFGKRIFHTHAKDCLVDEQQRAYLGVLGGKWYVGAAGGGWWRYVIPGFGNIQWGKYIGHLREAGYKGVLSIEHEDSTFGPEEGFRHGAHHLNQFCAA
jgi:sugar phosphate isomerase/epimerase